MVSSHRVIVYSGIFQHHNAYNILSYYDQEIIFSDHLHIIPLS